MSKKGSAENVFRRSFLFFLPPLFFLLSGAPFLFRPLWFDEALTLLNFALLPSPAKIYFSYFIPNNQILHTVFLHFWISFSGVGWIRFFPLLTALILLGVLGSFRSRLGAFPLLLAMTALALSPPFLLYGTAIRGYMLSALFAALACRAGCDAVQYRRFRAWALYFLFSLAAVGTMPGALAALAGAGLYAAGLTGGKRERLLLFILPAAAFLLFYAPIAGDLLRCAALKEGWQSGNGVLLAVGTTLAAIFFPLLLPAGAGVILSPKKSRFWSDLGIFLLIPAAAWILDPAPFPRVFFPLFPLFVLLAAGGVGRFLAFWRRRKGKNAVARIRFALFALTLFWGVLTQSLFFREKAGCCQNLSGQDDFWDPAFLRPDFQPDETAAWLRERFPGEHPALYLSFESDPWAVIYAFALTRGPTPRFLFDGPRGAVRELSPGTVVVLHRAEDPETVAKRFHCHLDALRTQSCTTHRIYQVK